MKSTDNWRDKFQLYINQLRCILKFKSVNIHNALQLCGVQLFFILRVPDFYTFTTKFNLGLGLQHANKKLNDKSVIQAMLSIQLLVLGGAPDQFVQEDRSLIIHSSCTKVEIKNKSNVDFVKFVLPINLILKQLQSFQCKRSELICILTLEHIYIYQNSFLFFFCHAILQLEPQI